MAEPFTIYKLTILNMLDKVDFPLTNTQISDFFLEQEYTDYFRVQQVLNDLADSGLIRTESTHSNTQYYITAAGRETLGFFRDKLTDAIEHDTIAYFEKNKMALRNHRRLLQDAESGLCRALPVPRPRHQPDRPDTDRQKQRAGGSDL